MSIERSGVEMADAGAAAGGDGLAQLRIGDVTEQVAEGGAAQAENRNLKSCAPYRPAVMGIVAHRDALARRLTRL
jgi:hypothetical protein